MNGMDDKARRTLQILDEVAKDNRITQRTLSERLGVALGCTNLYIKQLIQKGFIKVRGIPGKRYFYYLTPTGFSEKAALSLRYVKNSWQYYQELRKHWRLGFTHLQEMGVGQVVLCGTGEMAEMAYLSLRESDLQVVGIVDEKRAGSNFCGQMVEPYSAIQNMSYDRIIITEIDHTSQVTVHDILMGHGVQNNQMVHFSLTQFQPLEEDWKN